MAGEEGVSLPTEVTLLFCAAFVLAVSKGQLTQKCVFVSEVSKQYSKSAQKRRKAQPRVIQSSLLGNIPTVSE